MLFYHVVVSVMFFLVTSFASLSKLFILFLFISYNLPNYIVDILLMYLSLSLFLSYFLKGLLCFAGEIYFEDRNTKFPCSLGSTAQRR